MTIVYIEGCEDLVGVLSSVGSPTIVAGRTGNAIQVTGNSGRVKFQLPAGTFSDTLTVGIAFQTNNLSLGSGWFAPGVLNLFGDGGTTVHIGVNLATGGTLTVVRGQGTGSVLATSAAGTISAINTWYYLELQAKMHDTTGFVTLRVNGVVVASATNVDTRNAGTTTTFDTIDFGVGASGTVGLFDDLYVKAGAGETFLGDCRVDTLVPDGNGNVNQWIGSDSDSTNNYLLVDEIPPSSTDNVQSGTVGQQDLYTLSNVSGTGSIHAVAVVVYASKDDIGTRSIKPLVRRTATNSGADLSLASTTYAMLQRIFATDPETGAAWIPANINALQAGAEVV